MEKELLHLFFLCRTTVAQEKRIMEWLGEDPSNMTVFNSERMLFEQSIVSAPAVAEHKSGGRFKRWLSLTGRIAAILLLVFGLSVVATRYVRNDYYSQTVKVNVPYGQRMTLTLQDGTEVWLNSGSELEYPVVFRRKRTVKLSGEALFDVVPGDGRMFTVETFACDVKVLGTKFNVMAEEATREFSASLLEGSVSVVERASGHELKLQPGESVVLSRSGMVRRQTPDNDRFLWPDGIVTFSEATFGEMMRKIERYYGVNISIETDDVPTVKFFGKLRVSEGAEQAMRILQRAASFTYIMDMETNTIHIR